MEVVSQLYLALDEKYLTQELLSKILEKADFLAAQIASLSKALGRTPRSLKRCMESRSSYQDPAYIHAYWWQEV